MSKINLDVPFFCNTDDGIHCWQACLRMVLKYFEPEKDFSWDELDKISHQTEGKWTWPYASLNWAADHGYTIRVIEKFDTSHFVQNPRAYMLECFGEEKAAEQEKHSDIPRVIEDATNYLSKEGIAEEQRFASEDDLKNLLSDGFLLICNVDSGTLNDKKGYSGHFVVIKGYKENNFLLHDPGLPPRENRVVSRELFKKAWAYPAESAQNITAFKLNR